MANYANKLTLAPAIAVLTEYIQRQLAVIPWDMLPLFVVNMNSRGQMISYWTFNVTLCN